MAITYEIDKIKLPNGDIVTLAGGDDKTWNGVSLSKSSGYTTGDGYVPFSTSTSPSSMSFTKYTATPSANEIAKYNSNAYLISTTPSANDNSTKVATTAYVDAAIPTVLDPLIGNTTTITPTQVKTALGEGRDICVSASGTLAEVPLTLKFTSWNSATDTSHSGQAIDVVVSQTIARYGFQYYLFELVGLVSSGEWYVYDPVLAIHGDDISAFNNDVGYITSYTETDPTVPSWAKASTKPSYTASEVGALANTGGEVTGDIVLKSAAATNSPSIIFQRGTLTDNYNDWRIQDRGGYLYFEQRGSGSTDWTQEAMINTNGTITATTFSGNIAWSNVTGKPTFATVATSGSYNDLSDKPTIPTVPSAGTTATTVSTTSSGGSATTWSKSDHVHSISSSTITSALGYTPYNSTNPNGYITSSALGSYVAKSGDTMTGDLTFSGYKGVKFNASDSYTSLLYMIGADGPTSSYIPRVTFDKQTKLENIATPTSNTDAANKKYVDDSISGAVGVTNITLAHNYNNGSWTYPTKTPTSVISDFNAGKAIILEFSYIEDSTTYKTYGKMLDYSLNVGDNTSGAITFSLMSFGVEPYLILQLSFSSNSWAIAIWFNPATEFDPRCYWIRSSQSTNLNYWTEPGTYKVEDGETYTNLPNFQGYSFTSGIVEVLVTENHSSITQRFIVQSNNSSGSNIYAIRHKTGNNWENWHFDNNMSSYLKWDTGSHNADYAVPGTTWCRAGSSYTTNLPVTTGYGMLTTTGHWELDNSCSHQTYTEYSSSNLANTPSTTGVYVRDSVNGNWSAWVKIGPASYTDANNNSY